MRVDGNGAPISIAIWNGCQILNMGVGSANIQLNTSAFYRLWSSVNSFFVMGPDNSTTATTSSHPLQAGLDILIYTGVTNNWLAGVVGSGTGVLFISAIDPRSA